MNGKNLKTNYLKTITKIEQVVKHIKLLTNDAQEFGRKAKMSGVKYELCTDDKYFVEFLDAAICETGIAKEIILQSLYSSWWHGYEKDKK